MELGTEGASFFAFAARLACLVSCSNLRFASSALSISTSMQGVGAAAATGAAWGGEGTEDSDGPAGVLGAWPQSERMWQPWKAPLRPP